MVQPDKRLTKRTQKRCSALAWLDRRRVPGSCERKNLKKKLQKRVVLNRFLLDNVLQQVEF